MKAPTTIIPVEGMRCVGCALKIEKQLQFHPGVEWVSVNFASKKVLVRGIAPVQELIQAIESLGYQASIDKVRSPELEKARLKRHKLEALLAILFSIPVFLLSMGHVDGSASRWVQFALTLPVLVLGRQFYIGAWRSLKNRTATMDTLVAIGTGSAFITSCLGLYFKFPHLYFESAAVIVSLVLLGRALEEAAKNRSSKALTDLMTLTPQVVTRILKKGDLELNSEIKISELIIGDRFLVKPGEIIATDGKVVEGISSVEESKLTGESAPKEKTVGSLVYGGTLNQNGRLVVEATALGEQTRLSTLIRLVEEAQGSKTEIQRLADKISSFFVPAVLVIAWVTLLGWKLTGHSWLDALIPSISVLVIACPCALGLATPTALITGIGRAAELGILIRDARSLELSHKVNVVLLDKTGTLTEGTPKVVQSYYCPTGKSEFKFVSAIENQASHPFAKAISQYAKSFLGTEASEFKIEEFKNIPGMGCSGIIEGKRVLVGSRAWVESQGINTVVDWLPHGEIEKIKAN
ncbi:MAG: heavy metal translocating P-type ATPase, partial [Deltaproteobacteria bacterium]